MKSILCLSPEDEVAFEVRSSHKVDGVVVQIGADRHYEGGDEEGEAVRHQAVVQLFQKSTVTVDNLCWQLGDVELSL